jgi:hypothetical protein
MADQKPGGLSSSTQFFVFLTALIGLIGAIIHFRDTPTPSPTDQSVGRHSQPDLTPIPTPAPDHVPEPPDVPPKVPSLVGSWSLSGHLPNGAQLSGQASLRPDGTFATVINGFAGDTARWSTDSSATTLQVHGTHYLYGTPVQFDCTLLDGDQSNRVFKGDCKDGAGTSSLRLERY